MAIELHISFDGTSQALREHRLSVAEFARALVLLRAGLRREARKIEKGVEVDLELKAIEKGSAVPAFVIKVSPGPNMLLPIAHPDIARAAAVTFMKDVEAEAKGQARSRAARSYLRAIPQSVTAQSYTLRDGEAEILRIPVGGVELVDVGSELPRLREFECAVLGVQFAPAPPRVELYVDGKRHWYDATAKQVERALELRGRIGPVFATVIGRRHAWRLGALRERQHVAPPPAERTKLIAEKWHDVLTRLAS